MNDNIFTWQDCLSAGDRVAWALEAVRRWRQGPVFRQALDATAYFRGENTTVAAKTVLQAGKVETRDENGRRRVRTQMRDVVGNRLASRHLFRFVTQQVQYLLGSGVELSSAEVKRRLGSDFDRQLADMGEKCLLHGCCYGLWQHGRLEVVPLVRDALSGFLPLADELTGETLGGVQFWQLSPARPLYLRLMEPRGETLLCAEDGRIRELRPLQPWTETLPGRPPLVPLWANQEHCSEFTPAIRSKIDAFDRIFSDFADNLDRANDVYWVLNNFGGTSDEIAEMLAEISRVKAVASLSDGSGASATAEPHTIAVPFEARQAALKLLTRELYRDWMALDTDELTGGSLTNVAIRTAAAAMELKANRFEWECYSFVRRLLLLLGEDAVRIRFQRETIANASETVGDIAKMRADIDLRTALRLNPYVQPDETEVTAEAAERERRRAAAG